MKKGVYKSVRLRGSFGSHDWRSSVEVTTGKMTSGIEVLEHPATIRHAEGGPGTQGRLDAGRSEARPVDSLSVRQTSASVECPPLVLAESDESTLKSVPFCAYLSMYLCQSREPCWLRGCTSKRPLLSASAETQRLAPLSWHTPHRRSVTRFLAASTPLPRHFEASPAVTESARLQRQPRAPPQAAAAAARR